MTLVRIPWQPHLWLTPSTMGYLQAASNRVGRNLYLYDKEYTRISPAWRSYAQQATAYAKWLARTGPVASSPDLGQRNHMRGAAFDLRESSASVQAACRAVGLTRDTTETWHWNDPHWASMPIIPTNTSAAGGGAVLLTRERQDVYIIDNLKNDINDPKWPVGRYIVTSEGVGVPKNAATFSAINRLNGSPSGFRGTPLFSSEVKALDADIRATKNPR